MNKQEIIEEMFKETTVCKTGRDGYQRRFYKGKYWYRVLWDLCNPELPCKDFDIHHKDFDELNDNIENLARLTRAEHTRLHALNRSDETKKKMSENHADVSGANHPKAKTIMAEYQIFSTMKLAGRAFSVTPESISYRIKRNVPGYFYI